MLDFQFLAYFFLSFERAPTSNIVKMFFLKFNKVEKSVRKISFKNLKALKEILDFFKKNLIPLSCMFKNSQSFRIDVCQIGIKFLCFVFISVVQASFIDSITHCH